MAVPLVAICLLIGGCGGGGSDEPSLFSDENIQPSDGAPVTTGNLNAGLTGRLISTVDFRPYEFDLATGAARSLPVETAKEFLDARGEGEFVTEMNFFAANDIGSVGYVETNYRCVDSGACLSVYDEQYNVVNRISISDEDLSVPAKLSRSGRYLLVSEYDAFFSENSILMVDVLSSSTIDSYTPNHDISTRNPAAIGPPVIEWGADDRAIFTLPSDIRPTVYITEPGSMSVDTRLTLPSQWQGRIAKMDMHPDGNQLLLEYRPRNDGTLSVVMILNLSTMGIRIPVVNPADADRIPLGDNFVSMFRHPMWSPDGENIAFRNGFDSIFLTPINGVVISQSMIVVPADSNRLQINQPGEPLSESAVMLQFQDVIFDDGRLGSEWRGDRVRDGGYVNWVR